MNNITMKKYLRPYRPAYKGEIFYLGNERKKNIWSNSLGNPEF